MGNEVSTSTPGNRTFKFEVEGGIITVNATPSSQVIQQTDLVIFNLTDQEQIMKRYFQVDTWASYICSSKASDYNLDWSGMNRRLCPVKAKIVNQRNKLVTVQSTELKNTSIESGEFTWNANRSAIMEETFKRKYFAETSVTSKVEIGYKILTLGTVEFSRKTTENVESEHMKTTKLSTQSEIKVNLEPNRSVRVDLQAIFHTVDVEVEYEASFYGVMQVYYGVLRGGILNSEVLAALPGVHGTAIYKEIITVEYYTDGDRVTMTTISRSPNRGTDTNDTSSSCMS